MSAELLVAADAHYDVVDSLVDLYQNGLCQDANAFSTIALASLHRIPPANAKSVAAGCTFAAKSSYGPIESGLAACGCERLHLIGYHKTDGGSVDKIRNIAQSQICDKHRALIAKYKPQALQANWCVVIHTGLCAECFRIWYGPTDPSGIATGDKNVTLVCAAHNLGPGRNAPKTIAMV